MNSSRAQEQDVVRTLDPAYYTSEAIYQQECAGLFMWTWQYAGHVSQEINNVVFLLFEISVLMFFFII